MKHRAGAAFWFGMDKSCVNRRKGGIDRNRRTLEDVGRKSGEGMNETQNIDLDAEFPFKQGIEQSFAKHQNQSDVSHSNYRREKHLALKKELQGRTLIYLDTNHWVHLRNVILNGQNELPGYREILGLMKGLTEQRRILCPVSYPLFLELMRQSDPVTRLATARLMDFYSDGVCILDASELNRMELRRLFLRVMFGEKAPDWDEWVWSKCGYLFNEDSLINEAIPEDVPEEMKDLLLKVSVDFNWMVTFEYLAEKLMPGRPEWPGKNLADATIALMEQDRLAKLSFQEVFLHEKDSLLRRLNGKYQENITREVWEAYPDHHDIDKWHSISEKGIDPHAIPSLQVVAGVNAAFAVSQRKLSPNDISDFQHAALAVPYFDALFCDDGMATMLNDKPLEFGKIYNTDIISRPNEIRDYLVRLLN
jgi:hypothetical protein